MNQCSDASFYVRKVVVIHCFLFPNIGKNGIKITHTFRMKRQTPHSCDEGQN